jgi:hypothetical protein
MEEDQHTEQVEIGLLEEQLRGWTEEDQQSEVEIMLLEEQLREWAELDLN